MSYPSIQSTLTQILIIGILLANAPMQAQTCGQLFWQETFGTSTGQLGSPNPNVNTNYQFQNYGIEPGNYGIMKAFNYHSAWHVVPEDHTPGDVGGNFMVIDGNISNPIFYSVQINNLPLNTSFEFSGWAMNIDLPIYQSNLTFAFRVIDQNGAVIANTNTGIMPATQNPIWTLHQMTFNSGNNSSIVLQLQFTATGYDDFAFDDFALVQVGDIPITQISQTICDGQSLTVGNTLFNAANPSGTVILPSISKPWCDSTIIVNLTFGSIAASIQDTLCFGDSLTVGNVVFDADNPSGTVVLPSVVNPACDSTIHVSLVFSQPIILEAGIDQTIELGQSATLTAFIKPNISLPAISWTPDNTLSCADCAQTIATPTSTTTYQIAITYPQGCTATDALTVQVIVNRAVYIPNTFSPDTKGANNFFTIFTANEGANINILQVFDRWGNLVFEKSNFAPNQPLYGWDGYYRGKPADVGVYVYYAQVGFLDGSALEFKGDVLVVR